MFFVSAQTNFSPGEQHSLLGENKELFGRQSQHYHYHCHCHHHRHYHRHHHHRSSLLAGTKNCMEERSMQHCPFISPPLLNTSSVFKAIFTKNIYKYLQRVFSNITNLQIFTKDSMEERSMQHCPFISPPLLNTSSVFKANIYSIQNSC